MWNVAEFDPRWECQPLLPRSCLYVDHRRRDVWNNSSVPSLHFRTASCGYRGKPYLFGGASCGNRSASVARLAPAGRPLPPSSSHFEMHPTAVHDQSLMSDKQRAHTSPHAQTLTMVTLIVSFMKECCVHRIVTRHPQLFGFHRHPTSTRTL